jgi:aldose 1-epimerase
MWDAGRGQGSPQPLSGRQFTIKNGAHSVTVTELGAGLRSYQVGDVEFLDGFPADGYPTGSSNGQVLTPWPNRVDMGKYTFEGVEQQLPWNETSNQNAIHGLTRWMNWEAARIRGNSLSMRLVLHAQPGYPFTVRLQHDYTLGDRGLTVTHAMRNIGASPVPYGVGMHPYFTVGTPVIDESVLSLPADQHFQTNDRSIPTGPAVPVDGTDFDFRNPHPVGSTMFDTGFTGLERDSDGTAKIELSAPSGRSVTVWLDRNHEYVWIYSGDTLSDTSRRRQSLAIEPYTCASDAFNNGFGVKVVPPGGSFRATWRALPRVP